MSKLGFRRPSLEGIKQKKLEFNVVAELWQKRH